MRIDYAMVFVSDMARSVAFYRDVVGLPLRFESPEWTEFATDGATLALHRADGDGREPDEARPGEWGSGFATDDLDGFHARMVEHGVRVMREPRDVHGVRIAQYADPDGTVFSVSQPPG